MADRIGHALGLTHRELKDLHKAGLLHDIGKIGIPGEILNKQGKLTDKEYQIITEHPKKGELILNPIEDYAKVIPMAMQHHEWFNGKGYPDNLAGEAITLGGRILGVADAFDAAISDRPYRSGMTTASAVQTIKDGSGTQFDPNVVKAFLKVMAEQEIDKRPSFHLNRL
jgi:HD-GYP domain-containing protein (c-di-GMP phosphodiesterase class II)